LSASTNVARFRKFANLTSVNSKSTKDNVNWIALELGNSKIGLIIKLSLPVKNVIAFKKKRVATSGNTERTSPLLFNTHSQNSYIFTNKGVSLLLYGVELDGIRFYIDDSEWYTYRRSVEGRLVSSESWEVGRHAIRVGRAVH